MLEPISFLCGYITSSGKKFETLEHDDIHIKELEQIDPSIKLVHQLLREQDHVAQRNYNVLAIYSNRRLMMRHKKSELERKVIRGY